MEKVVIAVVLLLFALLVTLVVWRLGKWRQSLTIGSKVEFKRHKLWYKGSIVECLTKYEVPTFYVSVNGREYLVFGNELYPQNGSELFWL